MTLAKDTLWRLMRGHWQCLRLATPHTWPLVHSHSRVTHPILDSLSVTTGGFKNSSHTPSTRCQWTGGGRSEVWRGDSKILCRLDLRLRVLAVEMAWNLASSCPDAALALWVQLLPTPPWPLVSTQGCLGGNWPLLLRLLPAFTQLCSLHSWPRLFQYCFHFPPDLQLFRADFLQGPRASLSSLTAGSPPHLSVHTLLLPSVLSTSQSP